VYPWGIIYERRLVSGMYSVSEQEIKMALRLVYERMKIVIEPSSAVSLAIAVSILSSQVVWEWCLLTRSLVI
jgi:threonine dehydratase